MMLKDLLKIDFNRPQLNENELTLESKKIRINEKIHFCNSRINTLTSLVERDKLADAILIARFFIIDVANILFLLNDMDEIDEPSQLKEAISRFAESEISDRFLSNEHLLSIIDKKNIDINELRKLYVYIKELYYLVEKKAINYIKIELTTPVDAYRKKIVFQGIFYSLIIIIVLGVFIKVGCSITHKKYLARYESLPIIENAFNYENFIKTWLVLGDIPEQDDHNKCLYTDFLIENGGEKKILPRQGMAQHFKDGATSKWMGYKSDTDLIDFNQIFRIKERTAAYAFTTFVSPVNQKAVLAVGSDDGIKVWLNGRLVHQVQSCRPAIVDQDKTKIQVRKGKNTILVKVSQDFGGWGFFCRLFKVQ